MRRAGENLLSADGERAVAIAERLDLGTRSLAITGFRSKRALREHLAAFFREWNSNPTSFEWAKPAKAIIDSHKRMLDRTLTAVH